MRFRFKHHIIDDGLPPKYYAQTALADLDNCGRPEYIVGEHLGRVYAYKYRAADAWTRHVLGDDSPSDVGAAALDVDGDGWIDYVAGGAWYRNSRDLARPFERIVFDPSLEGVHDLLAADIDGDGRAEVVTMSDRNNLRWYRIPADPSKPWVRTDIGPAVHAGAAVGDLNGDGALDIVRTNVWYENVSGDGSKWVEHPIGPNTPPPPDFQEPFAFDATRCVVCDMNGDGRNDIVFVDAEIPGGKVWWMENVDGKGLSWKRHDVFCPHGGPRRGAFHGIYAGDLDGDGDFDLFACEMEAVGGDAAPRYYIWENLDGKGMEWREHVILDANLGGHDSVVGDVTGNGLPDIISKPWSASKKNALGGKMFVVFLENISEP
jgi:hypothetical protein